VRQGSCRNGVNPADVRCVVAAVWIEQRLGLQRAEQRTAGGGLDRPDFGFVYCQ
jgi:hypothetical protein